MRDTQAFLARLYELSGAKNRAQLSRVIGLTEPAIKKWEAGAAPRRPTMEKIGRALGINWRELDALIGSETPKTSTSTPALSDREFAAQLHLSPADCQRILDQLTRIRHDPEAWGHLMRQLRLLTRITEAPPPETAGVSRQKRVRSGG